MHCNAIDLIVLSGYMILFGRLRWRIKLLKPVEQQKRRLTEKCLLSERCAHVV